MVCVGTGRLRCRSEKRTICAQLGRSSRRDAPKACGSMNRYGNPVRQTIQERSGFPGIRTRCCRQTRPPRHPLEDARDLARVQLSSRGRVRRCCLPPMPTFADRVRRIAARKVVARRDDGRRGRARRWFHAGGGRAVAAAVPSRRVRGRGRGTRPSPVDGGCDRVVARDVRHHRFFGEKQFVELGWKRRTGSHEAPGTGMR